MLLNGNSHMPYMKSLTTCLNRIVRKGYTEDFKMTEYGLEALQHNKSYHPDQVQVVNYFRFEGNSDNAILLVIETADGTKGTLIGADDQHYNRILDKLMKEPGPLHKKVFKN